MSSGASLDENEIDAVPRGKRDDPVNHRTGRSLGDPTYAPAPGSVPPPGETIVEWLEENNHTQRWLAWQVGASAKHINQICNGHATYGAKLARELARVTGVSARFWMHLQADYQLNQAELEPMHKVTGPMPPAPKRAPRKERQSPVQQLHPPKQEA